MWFFCIKVQQRDSLKTPCCTTKVHWIFSLGQNGHLQTVNFISLKVDQVKLEAKIDLELWYDHVNHILSEEWLSDRHSKSPVGESVNESSVQASAVFCFCFDLFFLFMATPAAYVSSQARSRIWAAPTAYDTAMATPDPSRICNLCHILQQRWIFNSLSEARDQTHTLTETTSGP